MPDAPTRPSRTIEVIRPALDECLELLSTAVEVQLARYSRLRDSVKRVREEIDAWADKPPTDAERRLAIDRAIGLRAEVSAYVELARR